MQTWTYPAIFEQFSADEVVVTFRDLPEAITGAPTLAEARVLAEDVLEEAILWRLHLQETVPTPRPALDDEESVVLDPVTAARAALAQAMRTSQLTNAALARRLGRTEGAVRRLISGDRTVEMGTVLEALTQAGGKGVFVSL